MRRIWTHIVHIHITNPTWPFRCWLMGATATLMDQPDPKVGRLEALQYLQSQVDVRLIQI